MANANDTYYAQYVITEHILTFKDQFSDYEGTMGVQHGSTPTQFPVLKRAGYKFLGWWRAEGNNYQSETQVSESLQIYSDMEFHAHWEAINYEVEWDFKNCDVAGDIEAFNQAFASYQVSRTLQQTVNIATNCVVTDDIVPSANGWRELLQDVESQGIYGWSIDRWEVVKPNFEMQGGKYTLKCYWKRATYTI